MTGPPAPPGPTPLPRYVSVETSRPCDRTCGWCRNTPPGTGPRRHQELMDLALFRRIVGELGHLDYPGRLSLHHHTEPLRNRRLLDEIRYLRLVVPAAQPAIRTPGDLLDHAMFRRLVRAGLGHLQVIRYSRRADTPPSYAPIQAWLRRSGLLDRYAWQFAPVEPGGLAARLDLDGFHAEVISPAIPGGVSGPGCGDNRGERWRTLAPSAARPGRRGRTRPCQLTSTHAVIDLRGRLLMCRHVHPRLPAHAGYLLGDLGTTSLAELWQSERMAAYRAAQARADWSLSPICASCGDRSS